MASVRSALVLTLALFAAACGGDGQPTQTQAVGVPRQLAAPDVAVPDAASEAPAEPSAEDGAGVAAAERRTGDCAALVDVLAAGGSRAQVAAIAPLVDGFACELGGEHERPLEAMALGCFVEAAELGYDADPDCEAVVDFVGRAGPSGPLMLAGIQAQLSPEETFALIDLTLDGHPWAGDYQP